MSTLKKFPSLSPICSTDELRPVMGYVLVTKEKFVATDAHVMIWHNTPEFFDEDFINQIPEKGLLIHREDWKKIEKAAFLTLKENMIEIFYDGKKRNEFIKPEENEGNIGKYPRYEEVIPKEIGHNNKLPQLSIAPELLLKAKKAINNGVSNLVMVFTGKTRAILLKEVGAKEDVYNGLLMPIYVKE